MSQQNETTANKLTDSERGTEGLTFDKCQAEDWRGGEGLLIRHLYTGTVTELRNGYYVTETGQYSNDRGRSWSEKRKFPDSGPEDPHCNPLGLHRLPNGELGYYYIRNDSLEAACGNETNNLFFRWSADEGETWSEGVQVSLDGLTLSLKGTMLTLAGGRLIVVVYSQFLSRMSHWGASWGTYKGARLKTETEGHFGQMEVVRVYFSDDNGRSWGANDGWIMGYRDGQDKWVDSFVEATPVQLPDGRVLLFGRSLVGRVMVSESADAGGSFDYAYPTPLMTSDSPGYAKLLPNGDLLYVWNQISREENRRGFRRCRLSSAISSDGGATWGRFKNIYSIQCLADRSFIPVDTLMTPIAGDDEVGKLPDDFSLWHYAVIHIVNDEVFLSYLCHTYDVVSEDGELKTVGRPDAETLILPIDWFYK